MTEPRGVDPDEAPLRAWGTVPAGELERVVVVSPHLDDAVLGCGRLMSAHPGATVVTVYAAGPERYPDVPTRWDALAGFGPGVDVLAARRLEDERALGVLGAHPVWLDHCEHQYLPREQWVEAAAVVDTLEEAVRAARPTAVFAPFGLANPDHVETHAACLLLRERLPEPSWFCYEDFGYKAIPGVLARRVAALLAAGLWPTPAAVPVDATDVRKLEAFACYASQVRALEADWAVLAKLSAPTPEQHWRLEPPPPGWGELLASRTS